MGVTPGSHGYADGGRCRVGGPLRGAHLQNVATGGQREAEPSVPTSDRSAAGARHHRAGHGTVGAALAVTDDRAGWPGEHAPGHPGFSGSDRRRSAAGHQRRGQQRNDDARADVT